MSVLFAFALLVQYHRLCACAQRLSSQGRNVLTIDTERMSKEINRPPHIDIVIIVIWQTGERKHLNTNRLFRVNTFHSRQPIENV